MDDLFMNSTTSIISMIQVGFQGEIYELVLETSWVARFVLGILLFFSIVSWGIILHKYLQIKAHNYYSHLFIKVFQAYGRIFDIATAAQKYKKSPLGKVFLAAYAELRQYKNFRLGEQAQLLRTPSQASLVLESLSRRMSNASMLERNKLEKNVIFLAMTGSVTPFIGLFGTVWGIMNSFRGISIHASASIATVAPGIAEALIATAAGLFAAIPGVIAYNYFQRKIMVFNMELKYFKADVLNYVQHYYLFPTLEHQPPPGDNPHEFHE